MKRLQTVSQYRARRWFLVLLLANALFIIFAGLYLRPLTSNDIVRFELAKEASVAESIVQEWKSAGLHEKAVHSIYLDFCLLYYIVQALRWHLYIFRASLNMKFSSKPAISFRM